MKKIKKGRLNITLDKDIIEWVNKVKSSASCSFVINTILKEIKKNNPDLYFGFQSAIKLNKRK